MGKIRATIIDSETGGTINAKAQVIDSSGHYIHPKKAIQKQIPSSDQSGLDPHETQNIYLKICQRTP